MKLYELAEILFETTPDNPQVILSITTPEIRERFHISGIHGTLADVPAYLGNYDVIGYTRRPYTRKVYPSVYAPEGIVETCKLTITI